MSRWSSIEGSILKTVEERKQEHFLKDFFENKAFIPNTEQEKREYHDFSFVSTAMAVLIYVAKSDGKISIEEKDMIMKELRYQLEQRHFEYKVLAEEISSSEMKILNSLFKRFSEEIDNNLCDLDEIIRIFDMIYQKNPYKRNFLLRLCFYVAYADRKFSKTEMEIIKELSKKLNIKRNDSERIVEEVRKDLKI